MMTMTAETKKYKSHKQLRKLTVRSLFFEKINEFGKFLEISINFKNRGEKQLFKAEIKEKR